MGSVNDVKDAVSPLTVTIRAEDRNAIQCDPKNCVIANAVRRMRGVRDVRVGATTVRLMKTDGWWVRYDLDQESIAMIRAYDADNQIMPEGMRVFLVPPHKRLGSRSGLPSGKTSGKGNGTHVSTRRPSTRHIFVDPDAKA